MDYKTRQVLSKEFLERVWETLNKKGNDYANDQDAFSNFTNTSAINKIRVEKLFLCEITKKVSRINELLDKPTAVGESIMDSLLDIAGYTCLMENYMRGLYGESEVKTQGINGTDIQKDRVGCCSKVHKSSGCK